MAIHMILKILLYLTAIILLLIIPKIFSNVRTQRIITGLVLIGIMALPAVPFKPQGLFTLFVFYGIAILEKILPRTRYQWTSDDNIKSAFHLLVSKSFTVGFFLVAASLTKFITPVPWSLSQNHVPIWQQAILVAVALDFKTYFCHRLMHKVDFLWQFHKLHHATEELSVLASSRVHVLDAFFVHLLPTWAILTFLGIDSFALIPYAILLPNISHWSHANIDYPKDKFPIWAYFISTPNFHAVHHTPDNNLSNFSSVFVIWDVLFGTFQVSKTPLKFGIDEKNYMTKTALAQQCYPFIGQDKDNRSSTNKSPSNNVDFIERNTG